MSDVFISYSRKDKEFVQNLHAALAEQKRDVWVDWEDIPLTADWWAEIKSGIDAAHTVVFVISPDSAQSKICYDEIAHAASAGKRIVPLLHRSVTNHSELHTGVTSHNWIVFENTDFPTAFKALITAMDTDLGHVGAHTRLLTKAREWQNHQANPGYLLSGIDLDEAETWLAQASSKNPQPTSLHSDYVFSSRKVQRRRQQQLLTGVAVALLVSIGLAILSLFLFRDAQIQRDIAYKARDAAESAQATAEFFTPRIQVIPQPWFNIYDRPFSDGQVLARLETPTELEIFGVTPDQTFYQVGYEGTGEQITGWVSAQDLETRNSARLAIQPRIAIYNPADQSVRHITPTPAR
jgi:hypothetical protein